MINLASTLKGKYEISIDNILTKQDIASDRRQSDLHGKGIESIKEQVGRLENNQPLQLSVMNRYSVVARSFKHAYSQSNDVQCNGIQNNRRLKIFLGDDHDGKKKPAN